MSREEAYQVLEEGASLKGKEILLRIFGVLRDECAEASYDVVISDETGYGFAGKRVSVGAFDIVVVDWSHPNYGYFADGMLWIRSLHQLEWKPYPVSGWTEQYDRLGKLLDEFPSFRRLFVD
jgi:hypothetical protein